jgi:alpha-tubulin suppressor-like RCC1 family protein
VPVSVTGISSAASVTAGSNHTCAALSEGTAACWGSNDYGQLGSATNSDSNTPVQVSGIP